MSPRVDGKSRGHRSYRTDDGKNRGVRLRSMGRCCRRDDRLVGARTGNLIVRVVVMSRARRYLFGLEITAAPLARAGGNALELNKQQRHCDEYDLGCARHPKFQFEGYHDFGGARSQSFREESAGGKRPRRQSVRLVRSLYTT
jgi:hypothetical protein